MILLISKETGRFSIKASVSDNDWIDDKYLDIELKYISSNTIHGSHKNKTKSQHFC